MTLKMPANAYLEKQIREKVFSFFKGNITLADLWFKIPNPELHGLSPNNYLETGQHRKLLSIINKEIK